MLSQKAIVSPPFYLLSKEAENRDIHQTIPDHRVKLTQDGWAQAKEAGHRLRALLKPDDTLHFFTSPYRRTRETTEGILSTLTSDEPSPSPFPRHSIKVYEEPRLREQDFGNFQPCSAEMERMWQERADYGHFFYRIPNGESAADAYDRISGFNESLWRQFGEDDCASVCVLVTHGLMSRVFLMKWYHFSVEYFEDLRNVNHCEFLIMRKKEDSGKYILENNLRTWSELKRERLAAQALKERDKDREKNAGGPGLGLITSSSTVSEKDREKEKTREEGAAGTGGAGGAGAKIANSPVIPVRKKWGGCPNGCDHGKHSFRKENSMHAMQLNGRPSAGSSPTVGPDKDKDKDGLPPRRGQPPATRRWQSSSEEDEEDPRGRVGPPKGLDVHRSLDEVVSSPGGTPSFIGASRVKGPRNDFLLSVGRDFGGSKSGNTSLAEDDTADTDDDDDEKEEGSGKGRGLKVKGLRKGRKGREESGMGRGAMADALGDQSDIGSDAGSELGDLERAEKEDKGLRGSVY